MPRYANQLRGRNLPQPPGRRPEARPGPLVVALLVGAALPLGAQAPADRAAIDDLRDSLAGVTDSTALKRLEAVTIEQAKRDRDNPMVHLRLGWIAYRLGELAGKAGKPHLEDAAGEFEWATELRPDWPHPWFGLGHAELALGEHAVIAIENIRQQLGKDYLSKAARAFARATEADPAFAQATIDLATTALGQRIRPRLDVALEAVRLAVASPAGRNAEVQLARGRVEREVGEVDSALAGFQAFLAVGGDSGIGRLELARTLYLARRPAARTAYLDGARAARSPDAVAAYRTDLSWIATPPELAAFDSLADGDARRTWLAQFWERRDFETARDDGERLTEHYRRWFYARRNFFLVSRHRHYDITEVYRTDQREFDDRGVVYLRHGEPDQRASYVGVGVEPNLSWRYLRRPPEGDLVFHFVAREDVQDYKLIESLADVLGFGTAVRAQGVSDPRVAELYGTRADFGPAYRRIADGMGAPGPVLADERRAGRRAIALGTRTDSYDRSFAAPLAVVAADFVVGPDGADRGQVMHVVFAVPAGRLAPTAGAEGTRYPLHFRLVVADSAGRPVSQLDTLRVFTAREPLRGGSYLVGRLALAVPAGALRYRMLVSTPDGTAGDLIARDSLAVPRLDGERFTASDLVMGREGSGLLWVRARDTVLLNPLDRVPEGSVAELYYEVYGLTRGAPYHTVVRLEREGGRSFFNRLFGGGRAPVLVEFDAAADGPVTRVHRGVGLRDTARGTYRLSITVTDPVTGQAVTRTRRFEVVARP